jgi:VWFA-related protein
MPKRIGMFLGLLILALAGMVWPNTALGQEKSNQEAGDQQGVLRSQVDLVSIYFTVRDDKKHLVSEMPQDKFRVSEDGRQQPIKFFAHHSDVVLNVGVLLDTGTNMAWILNEEAQASALFMKHVVRPTDLGFILSYASRVETVQVPTSDTGLLQKKVDTIRTSGTIVGPPDQSAPPPSIGLPGGGGTVGINGQALNMHREARMYDAIEVSTLHYLSHEVGRKAVVIVALSGDSKSESSLEDALDILLQHDVIAYVLQIYDPPSDRTHRDRCDVIHTYEHDDHGEEVLRKLAESTGGRMLEVRGMDKLEEALDQISDELHHQYSLGYYPDNKNWDGKFRKIQISTQDKGYKVFARKGYYANRPGGDAAAAH